MATSRGAESSRGPGDIPPRSRCPRQKSFGRVLGLAASGCVAKAATARWSGRGERWGTTEVCVVGARPGGLVLALLLQRAGIPCIVLERLDEDGLSERRAGAGLIEHRTIRLLDAHGLAEPILAHGRANNICEFRFEGQSFVLDYGELTGGHGHFIYAQHELVAALTRRFLAAGGEIHFGVCVTGVAQGDEMATVSAVDAGERWRAACGSAVRSSRAATARAALYPRDPGRVRDRAPPPVPVADAACRCRTIQAPDAVRIPPPWVCRSDAARAQPHPDMLEVPRSDTIEDWPDERIWPELQRRLHAAGEPQLARGHLHRTRCARSACSRHRANARPPRVLSR